MPDPADWADYQSVELGNHARGYECRTCFAISASEWAAKKHQEWHAKQRNRDAVGGDS